jgi:hypothetical protein
MDRAIVAARNAAGTGLRRIGALTGAHDAATMQFWQLGGFLFGDPGYIKNLHNFFGALINHGGINAVPGRVNKRQALFVERLILLREFSL